MPHVGWLVNANDETKYYSFDEAVKIAREVGSFYGWSERALIKMQQTREDRDNLTGSGATRCHRQRIIKADYDYYLDPIKLWAPTIGTAIHEHLQDTDNENHELKLQTTIPVSVPTEDGFIEVEVLFGGTIDVYEPEQKRITDYKTVSSFMRYDPERKKQVPRKFPEESHITQINLYRYLCELHGLPVESAQIWYVRTDKTATRRMVPVPLWSLEEAEMAVEEYALPLAEFKVSGVLPAAYPEEDDEMECKWCPVRDICRKLEKEGK